MTEISRRTLLRLYGLSMLIGAGKSFAKEDWELALESPQRDKNPLFLGHKVPPADDKSWREVDDLLNRSPSANSTPFQVASYFVTSVPSQYQMAWEEADSAHPTFANPLILRLFLSTGAHPEGDTTPWCGAFVNWCLKRAGIAGTGSASSQSFAEWGSSVWRVNEGIQPTAARPGDIAVFRWQSDPKHGHVGFFAGIDSGGENRVHVLGGNQITRYGTEKRHLIDVASLRTDRDLQLIGIRTAKGLRNA